MQYCTVSSISQQYQLILYCALILTIALVIAKPLSRLFTQDAYPRKIYRYALSFANFSFMGNAIVPAILGKEALYQYMLYILPLNLAVYTWGVMILIPQGKKKHHIFKSLCNPFFLDSVWRRTEAQYRFPAAYGGDSSPDMGSLERKKIDFCPLLPSAKQPADFSPGSLYEGAVELQQGCGRESKAHTTPPSPAATAPLTRGAPICTKIDFALSLPSAKQPIDFLSPGSL